MASRHFISALTAVTSLLLLGWSGAWAGNQIFLSGNVLDRCTLNVVPDSNAVNLALTVSGEQRVRVGSAEQDCNGRVDYILEVLSTNCLTQPLGAKVMDSISGESLFYSVESENPTSGGSAPLVTGLLATACTGQIARTVTHGKINNESSVLHIRFTGSPGLSAGTYQDTLTITLTLN